MLTIVLASGLEMISINQGTSLAVEIGFFVIPALVALGFFQGVSARLIAFCLLLALTFATVAVTIIAFFKL